MQMITQGTIADVIKQMTKFESSKRKATTAIVSLIGDRPVSNNKRKKLTKALLKQFMISDDITNSEHTQSRIRKGVCFVCGKFDKPAELMAVYWLCPNCELKYLGETKTSTKTIKTYKTHPRSSRSFRYYEGFESMEDTVIDGSLFVDDDEPRSVVALGSDENLQTD